MPLQVYATLFPAGVTTLDVYLNDHAFWRNMLLPVWRHTLGRCQVLKKWPSYRGRSGVLARGLWAEGALHFAGVAKRIGLVQLGEVEK